MPKARNIGYCSGLIGSDSFKLLIFSHISMGSLLQLQGNLFLGRRIRLLLLLFCGLSLQTAAVTFLRTFLR